MKLRVIETDSPASTFRIVRIKAGQRAIVAEKISNAYELSIMLKALLAMARDVAPGELSYRMEPERNADKN